MARRTPWSGYLVAMSESDKDPRPGEFTDPTASPDWTAPQSSQDEERPAPPTPDTPEEPEGPEAPQAAPTEQIPQGSDAPDVPPVPPAPSYDAPYVQPHGQSNPYAGSSAQPTSPYAASPPPPPIDPYAAPQPSYDPYAAGGAQAQQGGYPPYQVPGQWQAPPVAYGTPPPQNTSALVLTILSGIATLTCCLPMVVSLVMGIMALSKNSEDPEGSRRLTKWGWIVFGVCLALSVIAIGIFIAIAIAGGFDSGTYDSDYTY